ncbi:CTP synthase [Corynebacterium hylobatis]|uniref:CTP synthase n=1 Tax=Corynebacterium hylobatis TaxID=1859290 RepID=A0A3S0B4A6_9CORY|nr:CTP synthase [Corynebacterium hylobatis]RSZ63404.1 CTP synthase [Corynebacterium hylobatis]
MPHTTRHIIVTGGVVSSLGKGLTAASLGQLLSARGLRVTMQKLDPYLNVDPGTMNPFEHGEVFVTGDGAETDLDLGHYERFLDRDLDRTANITMGAVYSEVIAKERRGDYLGRTVQVIPHVTDEIRGRLRAPADVDVIITEIGGTVGDIESLPFLEAVRQLRRTVGRENIAFIHVSLVPWLAPSGELKTKPTQHSVAQLRSLGIQPDALVLRCDREVPANLRRKIAMMCDVEDAGVISCEDAASIYDIPGILHTRGLDTFLLGRLQLPAGEPDWRSWDDLLERVHHPRGKVTVGIVGKYTRLPDAYLSVVEAVRAAGYHHRVEVEVVWISAEDCVRPAAAAETLAEVDAVIIPGGFGPRGIEGMIGAVRHCRINRVPLLGICLGLQTVVIEAARAAGLAGATSTEVDPETSTPVIATMAEQQAAVAGEADLGGTMRLGTWPATLQEDSLVAQTYGELSVSERHRHRYEVNNAYREQITAGSGLQFSGTSPDGCLVEFVEYPRQQHPYLVATQAHPEYRSRPTRAHPLFVGLLAAAMPVD